MLIDIIFFLRQQLLSMKAITGSAIVVTFSYEVRVDVTLRTFDLNDDNDNDNDNAFISRIFPEKLKCALQ